jgi:hypothetical protein
MIILGNGRKKNSRMMFVVVLKEYKWIGIVLRAWNLREISQTLLGLVAQLFISLGVDI